MEATKPRKTYAKAEQIEAAKRLLVAMPDWSLKRIAQETGVSDSSVSRLYKEIYGTTKNRPTKQYVGELTINPSEQEPAMAGAASVQSSFSFGIQSQDIAIDSLMDTIGETVETIRSLGAKRVSFQVTISEPKGE